MIRESTVAKYIGRRYGRLVVESFSRKEGRTQYFYWCRCDCGTRKEIRIGAMATSAPNVTRSCGCYAKDQTRATHTGNTYRRLSYGQAARNQLLKRYKQDAARRGLAFALTDELFDQLTSSPCYYCDAPPSAAIKGPNNHGEYIHSGIDRVDNSAGYTPKNCVPCCKDCNVAKNSVSANIIRKAYQFLQTACAPQPVA